MQAALIHVLEGMGFTRRQRVTGAGLHVFPPTVVRATKTHQMAALSVVSSQPYRLHDGFGARHVKRHLIESRDRLQARDITQNTRVVCAKHRPKICGGLLSGLNTGFVKVVAKQVDAVGAGEVIELVAVQVSHRHAPGLLQEACGFEVLAQVVAILVRHAVPTGKLHVRDDGAGTCGHCDALGKTRFIQHHQSAKAVSTSLHYSLVSLVGVEKCVFIICIARQQAGNAFGDTRVPCQRTMLGAGQSQAASGFWK